MNTEPAADKPACTVCADLGQQSCFDPACSTSPLPEEGRREEADRLAYKIPARDLHYVLIGFGLPNDTDTNHQVRKQLENEFAKFTAKEAELRAALSRVVAEREEAVKEAVADVCRQMRQPLLQYDSDTARIRNVGIEGTNKAAETLARNYGVELGPLPEASDIF